MRSRSSWLSSSAAVNLSFAGALLVISFVAFTLYGASGRAREAARWVSHTQEVMRALGDARESFARVESAQRGYLLSGAGAQLEERESWTHRLIASLSTIEILTADNPVQQARSRELVDAMRERLVIASELGRVREQRGLASVPLGELQRAQQASQRFYERAAIMQAEEDRLLTERQRVELGRQRATSWVIAASFAVFLAVLLPAYFGVIYQSRRRRLAERQMTELVRQLPATVWQLRTEPGKPARYVFVGPRSERDRGFPPHKLLAEPQLVFSNVLPEDRARLQQAAQEAEREGASFDSEYRVRMPDGGTKWIRSSAALRRQDDGSVLWTGFWADISEQKALEQALQDATEEANRANRAKGTFLATMSHEIRTPMNGVLGLLELLNLTRLDSEQRATVAVITESGRALLRIIDDILDFSKVEAGRLELDPMPASVQDLVRRACQIHSGIASSRGLLLDQRMDPAISPVLVFDPLRVGQILNNFISNALKFTREGGVTVSVTSLSRDERMERLRFTVEDTGIGIPADAIAHLFEPFAQADAGTAARFGGTGLGLAICKRLAGMMNGSVSLGSQEGWGTTVHFEVGFPIGDAAALQQLAEREEAPRQLTRKVAARRPAPGVDDAEREGRLVLVVDDHPTNQLVVARQVAALGYGCLQAENGVQALDVWRSRRIGLVLTDCNMPELNGYDLARAIRAEEARRGLPRTPIVACTANALDNEGGRCLAAGMDDILIKPVNLVDLMGRLDEWLPLPAGIQVPSPPHGGGDELLDRGVLDAITGGDPGVERDVLLDLRHVNEADMGLLRQSLHGTDLEQAVQLAHRIKGAARTVGAERLASACDELERAARADDFAAVHERFARLEAEMAVLHERIDSLTVAARVGEGVTASK